MASKKNFETALQQLETIVHDLEDGDLPLDKALKKFEDGIQLSRYCSNKLEETEKRIEILMQDQDGKPKTEPFKPESSNGGAD
jgi:exodeoxyribonuclease VII small subunit